MDEILKAWREWLGPVLASVGLPWQHTLTNLPLIPDYYQPIASFLALVASMVTTVVGYGYYRTARSNAVKKPLVIGGLVFVVFLVLELGFLFLFGRMWNPDKLETLHVARLIWAIVYIGFFSSFTFVLMLGILRLIRR